MADATAARRPRGRPRGTTDAGGGTVQALERGLALLAALARHERITLTDLALRTGMPPSSAHRLLSTLEKHGFVAFDEASQGWSIGVEAFRIGSAFAQRTGLVQAGREVMRRLMQETGETANLAIADAGDVVFIAQVEAQHPIRAFFRPGTRVPMHASGIGKALLAALPQAEVEAILTRKGLAEFTARTLADPRALYADLERTRGRGWSLDDEEHHAGMRCVAAAIHDAFGAPVAGISVSGPAARLPDATVAEFGPRLSRAAAEITRALGGETPRPPTQPIAGA